VTAFETSLSNMTQRLQKLAATSEQKVADNYSRSMQNNKYHYAGVVHQYNSNTYVCSYVCPPARLPTLRLHLQPARPTAVPSNGALLPLCGAAQ